MGKVYHDKQCITCGAIGDVIEVWGKRYCRDCYAKKPRTGHGHSGMVKLKEFNYQEELFTEDGIHLERTTKGNKVFATLYLEHYPGSLGIFGRQCNYFIKRGNELLGIIGANGPPLHYKKFNAYFGDSYSEKNWLNNNVFRLTCNEKNLGTKVLKIFRHIIKQDYEIDYPDKLIGLVTFVEPPRTGAMYKADNWDYLGMTQGKHMTRRGDHSKWVNKEWSEGTPKHIYAKFI